MGEEIKVIHEMCSTHECNKDDLLAIREMTKRPAWATFIKVLESVLEYDPMSTFLSYDATHEQLRISQGAASMLKKVIGFADLNERAIATLSQMEENSQS